MLPTNPPTNQSFGKYIWQARRSKRLNQRELAKKLGIDATYLSKLENDRVEPSQKIIDLLAQYLELDAEELTYLAGKMPEGLEEVIKANYEVMPALFRRVEKNPSRNILSDIKDEQIAQLNQENLELKQKVSQLEQELFQYRFYSKTEIEIIANELLTKAKRSRRYQSMGDILDFLNLEVKYDRIEPDEQGAIIGYISYCNRKIIIDPKGSEFSKGSETSTIAHEIGHWVLHVNSDVVDCYQQQSRETKVYDTESSSYLCRSINENLNSYKLNYRLDHLEWQAQYFASCLLMPVSQLKKVIKGRDLTKWSHLYAISDELDVTISNLTYRLQDLGWIYIPKNHKQIYQSQFWL
ncbi:MAG: helix-turn-helix domain-containing protein [Microcystaceae cyanobacterium]